MKVVLALAVALFASSAFAEDTITLQLPAVGYSTSTTDGSQTASVATAQRSYAWLSVSHGEYLLYYYPLNAVPMLSASKLFGNYEVGVDLGSNSLRSDATSGTTNVYGGFVGMFNPLFSKATLELYLVADRFEAMGDVIDPSFADGTLLKVSADVAVPLNERLTYVGGLNYSTFDQQGTLTRTYGINVVSLRLSL